MDIPSITRLLLRLAHAISAAAWLGGGAYYVIALRPHLRTADESARAVAREAQREFGRWATLATLIMIGSGVVLMYDQLSGGRGSLVYVILLVIKVGAAAAAFRLSGAFSRRRVAPVRTRAKVQPRPTWIDRAWLILWLGTLAFVLGVALSVFYPSGIG